MITTPAVQHIMSDPEQLRFRRVTPGTWQDALELILIGAFVAFNTLIPTKWNLLIVFCVVMFHGQQFYMFFTNPLPIEDFTFVVMLFDVIAASTQAMILYGFLPSETGAYLDKPATDIPSYGLTKMCLLAGCILMDLLRIIQYSNMRRDIIDGRGMAHQQQIIYVSQQPSQQQHPGYKTLEPVTYKQRLVRA